MPKAKAPLASWRELIRQLTIIALDDLVTKGFSCDATKEGKLLPPFYSLSS
ncbi:hypothetical protein [Nostoc sp.]|uniref:hypothetical protein n=1 Tax=Nostoc sp. TaxID=1180 RepID=UPI002FF98C97